MPQFRCGKPKLLLMLTILALFLVSLACSSGEDPTEKSIASTVPAVEPTSASPTDVPPTDVPPTDVPPTDVPPTDVPSTGVPPTDVPPTDVPPTATLVPDPREEARESFLDSWNRSCEAEGYSPCPLTEQDLPGVLIPTPSPLSPEEAQRQFYEEWNESCETSGFSPCPLTENVGM